MFAGSLYVRCHHSKRKNDSILSCSANFSLEHFITLFSLPTPIEYRDMDEEKTGARISRYYGLPRLRSGKESTGQCRRRRRHGFDPWMGKIPWRRKGNPLLYSCLKNSTDRGAWRATVHGCKESDSTKCTQRQSCVPKPVCASGASCCSDVP